jgi:hypothetical protein
MAPPPAAGGGARFPDAAVAASTKCGMTVVELSGSLAVSVGTPLAVSS